MLTKPERDRRIQALHSRRTSAHLLSRLRRLLEPPAPFLPNPNEPIDAPLGPRNLYIGGAGAQVPDFINLDIARVPGVDVIADAAHLPFPSDLFQRIECDAVLEHVDHPNAVMREMERVLAPGGILHVVTPFCHPFHEYPKDYRRYTIDGLLQMTGALHVVAKGWRTGPTATILVFTIEYLKMLFPWRCWRILAHGFFGWLLFPLRYLDLYLFHSPHAHRIANHAYIWLQKPLKSPSAPPTPEGSPPDHPPPAPPATRHPTSAAPASSSGTPTP